MSDFFDDDETAAEATRLVVIPIDERKQRLPVIGRLRLGETTKDKSYPTKADTLIFTFRDREEADRTAAKLGGVVTEYESLGDVSDDRWKVVTETTSAVVRLPPNALMTCEYQMQNGRTTTRRCDGVTAQVKAVDGNGWIKTPCICNHTAEKACKPKLTAQIILPWCSIGAVLVQSRAHESISTWSGSVALITELANAGFPEAELRLQQAVTANGSHPWPELRPIGGPTFDDILTGAATAVALGSSASPQLAAAVGDTGDDDEVVEAEIIDDFVSAGTLKALKTAAKTYNTNTDATVNAKGICSHYGVPSLNELPETIAAELVDLFYSQDIDPAVIAAFEGNQGAET